LLQLHSPGARPEDHIFCRLPGGVTAPQDTVSLSPAKLSFIRVYHLAFRQILYFGGVYSVVGPQKKYNDFNYKRYEYMHYNHNLELKCFYK
jgi:hypothetical protein